MSLSQEEKVYLRRVIWNLDWIKILSKAIKNRPTSWYPSGFQPISKELQNIDYSPSEWRNASDEILYALSRALEEKGVLEPLIPYLKGDSNG